MASLCFPDTNAHYLGEKPQTFYSVRFAARELWGQQAAPQDSIYLDLWDDYLWTQPDPIPESQSLAALPQPPPRDAGGPVFAEPWQAQAFALAVKLSEQGHFTWKEWAAPSPRAQKPPPTAASPTMAPTTTTTGSRLSSACSPQEVSPILRRC